MYIAVYIQFESIDFTLHAPIKNSEVFSHGNNSDNAKYKTENKIALIVQSRFTSIQYEATL